MSVSSEELVTVPGGESTVVCAVPASGAGTKRASVRPKARLGDTPPAVPSDRFQPVGDIATGGMGTIRKVFDHVLMRHVALKTTLRPIWESPAGTLRFIEEAQITAQLDHPNVVPVHELGMNEDEGSAFFTMKLVEGETLSKIIRSMHDRPFSGEALERVLGVFLKVCDAVAFAHSRGVLHRDIKPSNVMVGSHGQVYLMDWGLASLLRGDRPSSAANPSANVRTSAAAAPEKAGSVSGTITYMAPEQALGRVDEIDERTDVFGLGGILYKLLTGKGPHQRGTYAESVEASRLGMTIPPEQRGAWPRLPPGLCRIAVKALSAERAERHASVEELKREVESFLKGGGWFTTQSFLTGELIVEEGAAGETAYIVLAGRCEVYKTLDGERHVLRQVGPGEIFGETAVLTRKPRTATVMALQPVTAMVITSEALAQELERTSWMRVLVEALAERFREADAERDTRRSAPSGAE